MNNFAEKTNYQSYEKNRIISVSDFSFRNTTGKRTKDRPLAKGKSVGVVQQSAVDSRLQLYERRLCQHHRPMAAARI